MLNLRKLQIIRFVWIRQTHQTCFDACILSQSKVIVRKLLVTYNDVKRPQMLIAEVIGALVNLNGLLTLRFVCFDCLGWF